MLVTKQWMERQYRKYNKLIFHGEMPKCEFKIDYNRDRWANAHCHFFGNFCITMSNYWDSPEWPKRGIFIHEMIHIYDFSRPDFYKRGHQADIHGEAFFKPMQRVIETKYHIPCDMNTELIRKVSTVNPDIVNGKVVYQVCVGLTDNQKKYGYLPRIESRKWGEEEEK